MGNRPHFILTAAVLLTAAGCPQQAQRGQTAGGGPAAQGPAQDDGCVITRKPDAEDAIALLGPDAWVYEFQGGVVRMKVQVYRKVVDSLASDKLVAPENLVYEQQSIDMLFFSFRDEDKRAEFDDAQFRGLAVVTLPESISSADASMLSAFRLEREVDGHRKTSTHSGSVRLDEFLPESYFAEGENYNNSTSSFSFSGADKATLLPGKSARLVDTVVGRGMTDNKFDALAIVLVAERLSPEEVKAKLFPPDKKPDDTPAENSPETTDSPTTD